MVSPSQKSEREWQVNMFGVVSAVQIRNRIFEDWQNPYFILEGSRKYHIHLHIQKICAYMYIDRSAYIYIYVYLKHIHTYRYDNRYRHRYRYIQKEKHNRSTFEILDGYPQFTPHGVKFHGPRHSKVILAAEL